MQGFRRDMEDAHCICLELGGHPNVAFFGVYDGHVGDKVAKHLAKELHHCIAKLPELDDTSLRDAVMEFDLDIGKRSFSSHGSTCVFCLLRPIGEQSQSKDQSNNENEQRKWKVTAVNVGDSRAMLVRADGTLVTLTTDHKPSNPLEKKRIMAAGGFVQDDRVDGQLAMSRAMGDFLYKRNPLLSQSEQKVIALPEIVHDTAYPGDRLLIVCDGLVESASNHDIAKYVHWKHKQYKDDPAEVMRELNLYSLARGSMDNHTGILISFEDGTGYTQPDSFVAGPFSAWKRDRLFVDAYLRNAAEWGQTADTLPKLVDEADATFSKDWRKIVEPEIPVSPIKNIILFILTILFLLVGTWGVLLPAIHTGSKEEL